ATRLRSKAGENAVQVLPDSPFAVVTVASPSLEADDLAELSRDFGEALSLQTQTVADLVVFDHFERGARTRGLTYAGEAGWVRVAGAPESWEKPLFFAQARLEELLLELEDDTSDEALLARETAELRKLWEVGRLVEGGTRPSVDANA